MRILLLCDDQYHPGKIPTDGILPLKEKGFTVEIISNGADFNSARLGDYNVVIMSKCDHTTLEDHTPWKTPAVQEAFIQYIENGGGLLVAHSGTVAGAGTQALDALVGCRFGWHPNNNQVTVDVIKPHPITAGVGAFTAEDEHYHLEILAEDADIFLASYSAAQGAAEKYESEPYFNAPAAVRAAGYSRTQGKGRVCVLTPGHTAEVWSNPQFQLLLENAVRWCAGDDKPR